MKIVFTYLTAFNGVGGIERYNRNFCKVLSDSLSKQHKVVVISLNDVIADNKYLNDAIIFKGCNGNRMKFVLHLLFHVLSSKIIIWGHINLYYLQLVVHWFMPNKKNILLTHGIDVWRPLNRWAHHSIRSMNKIFTVSNYTKDIIVNKFAMDKNKISIIHNTIDPYFKLPDVSLVHKPIDSFNVLTVCRIKDTEREKGYDKVLECLPYIQVPNLKYSIVGKYDVDEFERLTKIINDLQLESKVDIVGYVSDERLQSLYLNSDLFIMPSTKEGFGIVFIEAMLHGLPVIAGNKDGSVDALSNGELGQLINPHHKNEIVDSIQNVYKLKLLNQLNPYHIQDKVLRKFNFNVFSNRIVTEIDFIK